MSSYFNPLSWTRAQKNREALEKTNPQNPVFNEEDETFLHRITSQEAAAPPLPDPDVTVIADDGKAEKADTVQKEAAELILPVSPQPVEDEGRGEQRSSEKQKRTWGSYIPSISPVPVPLIPSFGSKKAVAGAEKQPKTEDEGQAKQPEPLSEADPQPVSPVNAKENAGVGEKAAEESTSELDGTPDKASEADDESTVEDDPKGVPKEDPKEIIKEDSKEITKDENKGESDVETEGEASEVANQAPRTDSGEEPKEQPKEEAEKEAVKELEEINVEEMNEERAGGGDEEVADKSVDTDEQNTDSKEDSAKATGAEPEPKTDDEITESKSAEEPAVGNKESDETTEATAQRTWASYIPALPSLGKGAKGKETASDIADTATSSSAQDEDERDVSVLLDRLNLSAINNRVFSISQESQKLLQSFTLILKDMVNGVPTAKDDLETLIKDNERQLEQMFGNMPPFVQTLVKSLPSRFAGSLGPEIMAAATEKPGNDLRARMEAASRPGPSIANLDIKRKQKQKRNTPGVKDLASEKGAVASMLSNILNFLKVRFPAFITGTNVLMSLAVFILLFVFYYCHKRGRESRLLKESESARGSADVSEVDSDDEESEADDEKAAEPVAVEAADTVNDDDDDGDGDAQADNDAEVPLPDKKDDPAPGAEKS